MRKAQPRYRARGAVSPANTGRRIFLDRYTNISAFTELPRRLLVWPLTGDQAADASFHAAGATIRWGLGRPHATQLALLYIGGTRGDLSARMAD